MIYAEVIGTCRHPGCGKPATHQLMRSGTDRRGMACTRHVDVVGRAIAKAIGEEYAR